MQYSLQLLFEIQLFLTQHHDQTSNFASSNSFQREFYDLMGEFEVFHADFFRT